MFYVIIYFCKIIVLAYQSTHLNHFKATSFYTAIMAHSEFPAPRPQEQSSDKGLPRGNRSNWLMGNQMKTKSSLQSSILITQS